jgi:hypothetical protein
MEIRRARDSDPDDTSSSATDTAFVNESAELEIRKGSGTGVDSPGAPATDTASVSDSAKVDIYRGGSTGIDAPVSPATDTVFLSESVDLEVDRAEPPPSGRSPQAFVQDTVHFVIRDSSGNIKDQGDLD